MISDRANTIEDDLPIRRYSSFPLRCWHVGETQLRIKIEHIQSDASTQVDTYEAVVAWLSKQSAGTAIDHAPPNRQARRVDGEE